LTINLQEKRLKIKSQECESVPGFFLENLAFFSVIFNTAKKMQWFLLVLHE
jgi:hypothetical protein